MTSQRQGTERPGAALSLGGKLDSRRRLSSGQAGQKREQRYMIRLQGLMGLFSIEITSIITIKNVGTD